MNRGKSSINNTATKVGQARRLQKMKLIYQARDDSNESCKRNSKEIFFPNVYFLDELF